MFSCFVRLKRLLSYVNSWLSSVGIRVNLSFATQAYLLHRNHSELTKSVINIPGLYACVCYQLCISHVECRVHTCVTSYALVTSSVGSNSRLFTVLSALRRSMFSLSIIILLFCFSHVCLLSYFWLRNLFFSRLGTQVGMAPI